MNTMVPDRYFHLQGIVSDYMSNESKDGFVDHIIKACLQQDPNDRPTIDDILKFLNGDIAHFDYELREMEKETGKKPKEGGKSGKGKLPENSGKGKHSGKKEKHLKLG
uniref:Uncharacterized protein n=1 Tax=Meloidogyne javanica TaxID=6303 RepID=A0A915MJC6_MELJA